MRDVVVGDKRCSCWCWEM